MCLKEGWKFDSHDADGGSSTGVVGDDGEDPEYKKYNYTNPAVKLLYTSFMHTWTVNGEHAGWRSVEAWRTKIHADLGHEVSRATAYRYFEREKALFDKDVSKGWTESGPQGLRRKPDVISLVNDIDRARKEAKAMTVSDEPVCVTDDRRFTFLPSWHEKLAKRCNELQDVMGFGVAIVQAFASEIYSEELLVPLTQAWIPSLEWCYWFLDKKLGLVKRRVTGSKASPEQQEIQQRLHLLNLQRLAILLHDGLNPKYIIGADEFGCHFFPHGNWKWEKKGAQHVTTSLKEDKRQYTGDIAHNAAGDIVCVHQIFAGKTTRSLPNPDVRAKYPQFQFAHTLNHWANHETKVAFLGRIWEWVVIETAKDLNCSMDEARQRARCVMMLDCWPVNLTSLFRGTITERYPGMELMFVPAGYTGQVQINDTHLHKPVKDHHRHEAHVWHMALLRLFGQQRRRAEPAADGAYPKPLTEAEYIAKVGALMKMEVLRNMAPAWLWSACESILKPLPGENRNLILKGWQQLYLDKARDPAFLMEAIKAREERARKAAEEKLATVAAAAAAAGAAAALAGAGGAAVAAGAAAALAAASIAPATPGGACALPTEVAAVAALEKTFHEAEVPTAKVRKIKSKERKSRREARQQPAASTRQDLNGMAVDGVVESALGATGTGAVTASPVGHRSRARGPSLIDLRTQCSLLGLSKSGNKADLQARLAVNAAGGYATARKRAHMDTVPDGKDHDMNVDTAHEDADEDEDEDEGTDNDDGDEDSNEDNDDEVRKILAEVVDAMAPTNA